MTGKWRSILLLAVLLPAMLSATVIEVPDVQPTIQQGVNAATNGDTVSVWGNGTPPFVYYENVNFGGKSVFLVNRSFLPYQTPGYDSSWDHVVIDGLRSGATVSLAPATSVEAAVKGFTVTGGLSWLSGGGISCDAGQQGRVLLARNRIAACTSHAEQPNPRITWAARGGGGIWVKGHWNSRLRVTDNVVENNVAPRGYGGGICVWVIDAGNVEIERNAILNNSAVTGGGVSVMWFPLGPSLPDTISYDIDVNGRICDNFVKGNRLSPAVQPWDSTRGGGIYCYDWNGALRGNVVDDNDCNGVYGHVYVLALPNLGRGVDNGFNTLVGNGNHDFVAKGVLNGSHEAWLQGNYWGTLCTDAARARMHIPLQPRWIHFDPVAASGKWFSVDGEQLCETDVLVTGDLVVEPEASLSIAPGKTFTFYAAPDHVETGHDPALCDLIVHGADGALDASGTESDSIRFIGEGPCGVMWGGVHFDAGSIGALSHCVVTDAYSGIRSSSATELIIADSRIESCEYCGVDISGGDATVSSSRLGGNGVYGVAMDQVGSGAHVSITGCDITGNGVAGVRVKGAFGQDAQCSVSGNIIEAGATPVQPAYGILVDNVRYGLSCEDNHCTGFHDAGIGVKASTFAANGNVLVANTYAGYSLMNGSTPNVRTSVVSQSKAGIQNDETSLGDFGSVGSPGLNSVVDNFYYVLNLNSRFALPAVYNWWGTPLPSPGRFIGPVSYYPWLTQPPQGGDGGQSAGAAGVTQPRFGVWPTPLRGRGTIAWTVDAAGPASVRIYDASGREVRELVNRRMMPGRYTAEWDGCRADGSLLPNGVYVCKVETPTGVDRQKVTVLR